MKKHVQIGPATLAVGLTVFFLSGCYTQFGSTKWDDERDYSSRETVEYEDTVATESGEECCGDDYSWRPRHYFFDYYYPSSWVSIGIGDPWYWRWRTGYYWYDPYYAWYDPWAYGAWWYTPYVYAGGYHPGYYHGGTSWRYRGGDHRTFGNTRGSGLTRGSAGGDYRGGAVSGGALPTGMRNAGSGRTAEPPRATTGRQRPTIDQGRTTRGSSGSGRGGTSLGTRRERTQVDQPRAPSRPSRESGSSRGSNRTGEGRSYTPPPSSPPPSAPSSPPPSGGGRGSDQGNSGGRGGTRR
jgi:hypothetical protein